MSRAIFSVLSRTNEWTSFWFTSRSGLIGARYHNPQRRYSLAEGDHFSGPANCGNRLGSGTGYGADTAGNCKVLISCIAWNLVGWGPSMTACRLFGDPRRDVMLTEGTIK